MLIDEGTYRDGGFSSDFFSFISNSVAL